MMKKRLGLVVMAVAALVVLAGPARADGNADPYLFGGIHWAGTGPRLIHVLDEVQLGFTTRDDRVAWRDELANALDRWTATGAVTFDVTVIAPGDWACDVAHPVRGFVELCQSPTSFSHGFWASPDWDASLHIWAAVTSVGYRGRHFPWATCDHDSGITQGPSRACVTLQEVLHELGHSLGLAHNYDVCSCGDGSYSVMGAGARPNADDGRNLRALYAHSD